MGQFLKVQWKVKKNKKSVNKKKYNYLRYKKENESIKFWFENILPFQTLVSVSLQSLTSTNLCSQYFNFCESGDGIVVTDIKNWSMSGAYGFIFHILLRLDNKQKMQDAKTSTTTQSTNEPEQRANCRRMLLKWVFKKFNLLKSIFLSIPFHLNVSFQFAYRQQYGLWNFYTEQWQYCGGGLNETRILDIFRG